MTNVRRFGLAAARNDEQAPKEPPPNIEEVVLEYRDGPSTTYAIERFPAELTPPAAIMLFQAGPQGTTTALFHILSERDEDGRLQYAPRPSQFHALGWKRPLCDDCRTDAPRFYKRWGVWRCKHCWTRAARAALPIPTEKD